MSTARHFAKPTDTFLQDLRRWHAQSRQRDLHFCGRVLRCLVNQERTKKEPPGAALGPPQNPLPPMSRSDAGRSSLGAAACFPLAAARWRTGRGARAAAGAKDICGCRYPRESWPTIGEIAGIPAFLLNNPLFLFDMLNHKTSSTEAFPWKVKGVYPDVSRASMGVEWFHMEAHSVSS